MPLWLLKPIFPKLQTHLLPCKPDKNTQIPQRPGSLLLPSAPSHLLPHFSSLSFGQDPSAPKIAKPKHPIKLLPSSPSRLLPHFSASPSAPLSPSQLHRPSLTVVLTDSATDPDCSGNSLGQQDRCTTQPKWALFSVNRLFFLSFYAFVMLGSWMCVLTSLWTL